MKLLYNQRARSAPEGGLTAGFFIAYQKYGSGKVTSVRPGGLRAARTEGIHEFTANERNWIEQATKRLIRRAAEVAYNPAAASSQITMDDLPKLQ